MKLYWILYKDLVTEFRSWQVWPAMLVLAVVVGFLFALQSVPSSARSPDTAQQIWIATYFAGVLAFSRSFDAEREWGCWGALLLYPLHPATIYAGKLIGNIIAIGIVQCVLVVFFGLVGESPFFRFPWHLLFLLFLGNVGISAVGTLVASFSGATRHGQGLVAVIVLPLVTPVLLVSSETTRLLLNGIVEQTWWDGVMLLATFAAAFCSLGFAACRFLFEE